MSSANPIIYLPYLSGDIRVDPSLPEKRLQLVDWFFMGDHDLITFFFGPNLTDGYAFLSGVVPTFVGATNGYFSRFTGAGGDGVTSYLPYFQLPSELITGMPGESMGVTSTYGNTLGWIRYREL